MLTLLFKSLGRSGLTAILLSVAGAAAAADLPNSPNSPIAAEDLTPFFARVGGSAVVTDSRISTKISGVTVAGGNGTVSNEPAAYVEGGIYFTHSIAASLSLGSPPIFIARGTGSLAPLGTLFKATAGLPVFQITYHLDPIWQFRPYAGLGVGYAIVFNNQAGALLAPKLHNGPALTIVGGIDYTVSSHWSIFIDVKKAFLTQDATGVAPPFPDVPTILPVSARVRTNPLLVSTGIAYRF